MNMVTLKPIYEVIGDSDPLRSHALFKLKKKY